MKVLSVVCAFAALFIKSDGLKVLGIIPMEAPSHFAIGNAILKTLHNAGHEITSINPFPQKKPMENFRDINVKSAMKLEERPNPFTFANMPAPVMFGMLMWMGAEIFEQTVTHPEVQKLMNSGEKFDVCVIEIFNTEALTGLADHFDCVLITFTTFGAVKWANEMTSNQMPASYVPSPFLHYTDKMTFTQRLHNTFTNTIENIFFTFAHMPNQRRLYRKHFPNARKSLDEMHKNSAIVFLNNHVSSSSARPYLPSVIEVCGVHVEPVKPLPKDMKDFLDSATEGAILFSMGSFVQSKDWEVEKREAFVKAFGKLKQKIIWKYENETLPNNPGNVMIGSWLPQRDVVAHPNIKLFITHGGLLGTTEALVEGVPVLGLPVFGDQNMNMAKAVAKGYGLKIDLDEITEEKVSYALNELLFNPKYKQNAEIISKRFVDRPMTPKEAVVYWTEYAVRHKGAPHLRAEGRNLNFIEFHLIDVYLTLGLIASIILYINYQILKFFLRKLCKKKVDKKVKKN